MARREDRSSSRASNLVQRRKRITGFACRGWRWRRTCHCFHFRFGFVASLATSTTVPMWMILRVVRTIAATSGKQRAGKKKQFQSGRPQEENQRSVHRKRRPLYMPNGYLIFSTIWKRLKSLIMIIGHCAWLKVKSLKGNRVEASMNLCRHRLERS